MLHLDQIRPATVEVMRRNPRIDRHVSVPPQIAWSGRVEVIVLRRLIARDALVQFVIVVAVRQDRGPLCSWVGLLLFLSMLWLSGSSASQLADREEYVVAGASVPADLVRSGSLPPLVGSKSF
jgi:hypothetical protein